MSLPTHLLLTTTIDFENSLPHLDHARTEEDLLYSKIPTVTGLLGSPNPAFVVGSKTPMSGNERNSTPVSYNGAGLTL
jgi:hypothetical protein